MSNYTGPDKVADEFLYATEFNAMKAAVNSKGEVLGYANVAAFPVTGVAGNIYLAQDTNLPYRWSGSAYICLVPGVFFADGTAGTTTDFTPTVITGGKQINLNPTRIQDIVNAMGITAAGIPGWKVVGALDGTPEIQALINALPQGTGPEDPTGGGVIKLWGTNTLATQLVIDRPAMSLGNGMKSTKIKTTSPTLDMIKITGRGVKFQDIGFVNTSSITPTAGSAIRYASYDPLNYNVRAFLKLIDCEFTNFFINADIEEQYGLIIRGCHFNEAVKWDLRLRSLSSADIGDAIISESFFIASANRNTDAGIRWESGGGLKIMGSKFNWLSPPCRYKRLLDGFITNTVDFMATGNSFENYTERGISIVNGGPSFANVAIGVNQFASTNSAPTIDVYLDKIYTADVRGNAMRNNGSTSYAFYFSNCQDVTIGNTYSGDSNVPYVAIITGGSGNSNIKQVSTSDITTSSNAGTPSPLATSTLTATAVSNTEIDLSWPIDGSVTSWKLEHSLDNSTWTQIGGTIIPSNGSYPDTGRTAGTLYYYRLTAVGDGTGTSNSQYATAQATTTGAGNTTPAAPTGGAVDDTANTFDWTHPGGYVTADEETTVDGGTNWIAAVKPLSVGDVAKSTNQVGVRVKAATGRNASAVLYNATAFTLTGGGSSYDTDAQAGFTYAGITDTNEKNRINTIIAGAKTAGIWSSVLGFYLHRSGTATKAALNWKSPGTHDMTPGGSGTPTYGVNGVTFDGSSYLSTGIIPSTDLTLGAAGISWYGLTDQATGGDMGIGDTTGCIYGYAKYSDGNYYVRNNTNSSSVGAASYSTIGLFSVIRVDTSTFKFMRNKTVIATITAAAATLAVNSIKLGMAVGDFSTSQYSCCFVHTLDQAGVNALCDLTAAYSA